MIEKLERPTRIDTDKIEALKALFPSTVSDGRINFDALREELSDDLIDVEMGDEPYGLNWSGKRKAKRLAITSASGTLSPANGEGIYEDATKNLIIEGDNLEVLRILQKSYTGRIKTIYIDPPYNTGNDFVYNDDFKEPVEAYLQATGQADSEGLLTSNPKSSGRYHSNWLNMMYCRLSLARNLLKDSGLIFVSTDSNESDNLRFICNEIFGAENFVEQIIWKNKYNAGALSKGFSSIHEYILCYSRTPIANLESPLSEDQILEYKMRDSKFETRGGYVTQPLATKNKDDRANLIYPIIYKGVEILPDKQWIWSRERVEEAIANDEVVFHEKDNKISVRVKQYLKDEKGNLRKTKPLSILIGYFNQEGTKEIDAILGKGIFEFPKPSRLLKHLFSIESNEYEQGEIVLDFFAGSGTTAHSVMALNAEDRKNRSYILVQLPVETPINSPARKAGYLNIAEITKERVRRVSKKLQTDGATGDLGFRVLKLERSNFVKWRTAQTEEEVVMQAGLFAQGGTLVPGWKRRTS
jgi:adenine-specific DNA-methyltransferase